MGLASLRSGQRSEREKSAPLARKTKSRPSGRKSRATQTVRVARPSGQAGRPAGRLRVRALLSSAESDKTIHVIRVATGQQVRDDTLAEQRHRASERAGERASWSALGTLSTGSEFWPLGRQAALI